MSFKYCTICCSNERLCLCVDGKPCIDDSNRIEFLIKARSVPLSTKTEWFMPGLPGYFKTPREAIDAAMKESKE